MNQILEILAAVAVLIIFSGFFVAAIWSLMFTAHYLWDPHRKLDWVKTGPYSRELPVRRFPGSFKDEFRRCVPWGRND